MRTLNITISSILAIKSGLADLYAGLEDRGTTIPEDDTVRTK